MAKTKEFTDLLRSEIKKAESLANKVTGCDDCEVTGWSWNGKYETPFNSDYRLVTVRCEICHVYHEVADRAEVDILLTIPMEDRRRTYATVA